MNENSVTTFRILETFVAGVMHDARYVLVPQLALRELVQLKRKPDNPADANAIVVETHNGHQLGYIRRELAAYLAPRMDEQEHPIPAMVTELSSNAAGSAYRVRITFSVPVEWLNRQNNVENESEQRTEYYYDESRSNAYVLLNSSEERFNQIRAKMITGGIPFTRYGLCYRPAANCRPYQWFIRIDKTAEVNKHRIEDFFKKNFNVASEFEQIEVLEESRKRHESEIQQLANSLKEASDLANLAAEIDAERELAKQDLQRLIHSLEGENRSIEVELRRLRSEKRKDSSDGGIDDIPDQVADVFEDVIGETLTPRQCLLVIARLFPARIEVLESAFKSAEESESFRKRKRLFALLWKLATGYWYA